MPALPLTLRPSRTKWMAVALIAAAFTAMGAVMMRHGGTDALWGGASVAFFGLGTVIAVANLLPGASCLRLDENGFEMKSLYRRHRIAWADVAGFGVMTLPPAGKQMVGFNYVAGAGKPSRLRRFNLAGFGFEAALPDTYGMKIGDLVALLESIRARSAAA